MRSGILQLPVGARINRAHNLSAGLVGAWPLNEGGGLKAFDAANHNHGTLTNATFAQRQMGSAFAGNGTSGYIALGTTTSLNLAGEMSLSAWINTNTIAVATKQVLCNTNGAGNLVQWNIEINRTAAKVSMLANSAAVALTGATSLVINKWYHITGTRKGSTGNWTYTIYINGVQDAQATGVTGNPDAHQVDAIGDIANSGGQWFNGYIKHALIYNRALSAQEVRQLYADPYSMYYQPNRKWAYVAGAAPVSNSNFLQFF